jgi:hypothetical protein
LAGEQHEVSAHLLRHMNARADIQDKYLLLLLLLILLLLLLLL